MGAGSLRAGDGFLPDAQVILLKGPQAGQNVVAYLHGPGGPRDNRGYRVGEGVVMTFNETGHRKPDLRGRSGPLAAA